MSVELFCQDSSGWHNTIQAIRSHPCHAGAFVSCVTRKWEVEHGRRSALSLSLSLSVWGGGHHSRQPNPTPVSILKEYCQHNSTVSSLSFQQYSAVTDLIVLPLWFKLCKLWNELLVWVEWKATDSWFTHDWWSVLEMVFPLTFSSHLRDSEYPLLVCWQSLYHLFTLSHFRLETLFFQQFGSLVTSLFRRGEDWHESHRFFQELALCGAPANSICYVLVDDTWEIKQEVFEG